MAQDREQCATETWKRKRGKREFFVCLRKSGGHKGKRGEDEGRVVIGQSVQGLVGYRKNFSFDAEEGGSHGGCCVEEGLDLAQVFTDALWLLLGEHTEG